MAHEKLKQDLEIEIVVKNSQIVGFH